MPAFYLPERFAVESINITLMPTLIMFKPVRRLATKIVNSSMRFLDGYERLLVPPFPRRQHPICVARQEVGSSPPGRCAINQLERPRHEPSVPS